MGRLDGGILLGPDLDIQVGAVEAGDELVMLRKPQAGFDICPNTRGGGGGQRQAGGLREALAHLGQLAVLGAEVVAPLGDAVGFVDGQQVDFHAGKQIEQARGQECLGGHVKQAHRAIPHPGHVLLVFVRLERTIEEKGRNAGRAQLLDLILHQRDEWRDNHGQTIEQQCGNLIAERLSATGGHDRQGITVGHNIFNNLELERAEGVVAEGVFEDG